MDQSKQQPPQQTESAPESSKPGDPHAGHDTASTQSTQASNEPAQPQQMEHSMHAPAEQDRSVSKPPAEPVDPHAGHDMSEPMEPERTDMDHAGMEHGTPAAQQAEPMDQDRKSTRLTSSHSCASRMPSSP